MFEISLIRNYILVKNHLFLQLALLKILQFLANYMNIVDLLIKRVLGLANLISKSEPRFVYLVTPSFWAIWICHYLVGDAPAGSALIRTIIDNQRWPLMLAVSEGIAH